MTIREAKQLRTVTEQKIMELISEFQKDTELRVEDVELYGEDMSGNHSVRLDIRL